MNTAVIRNWIQLLFIIIAGTIGLIAFIQNVRQRRLENALKMVNAFREALWKDDIANWEQLFHRASEPAGAKPGYYVSENGTQYSMKTPRAKARGFILMKMIILRFAPGAIHPQAKAWGLLAFSISSYFSGGVPDHGSIARMTENLEIICHTICRKTVNPRLVWFELGQLMRTMHLWLTNIPSFHKGQSLLDISYPSIKGVFKKYNKQFRSWPCRTFSYVE